MNKNHMKEVAKLLGVELEERFEIENATCNPCYITEAGLYDCENDLVDGFLVDLLTGYSPIKKIKEVRE